MHLSCLAPVSSFSPSWIPSGCTVCVCVGGGLGAAVAEGLVAAASFVRWYGRGRTQCFFYSQSYPLSFHVGNSSSSFKTHSCITSWTKSSLTLSSLSISFPPSLRWSCIPSFIHALMNIHWARPACGMYWVWRWARQVPPSRSSCSQWGDGRGHKAWHTKWEMHILPAQVQGLFRYSSVVSKPLSWVLCDI